MDERAKAEIIVPIYNAPVDLSLCLDALAMHCVNGEKLLLIDDGSTHPDVQELLDGHQICRRAETRVLRNDRNLGFVATVNRAVEQTADDFVLLNSDTLVTGGWLKRLVRCAYSCARVASVTPWSNNAEICSFPRLCHAAGRPARPDELASAIASFGVPLYPEIPTAIGFCMYIRREVWEAIGDLDEATFGRGYGEENDWCMRASAFGYRHLLCDDAYVVHTGGASFAETGHRPGGEQLRSLLARYPYYNDRIADFIRSDPLAERRDALSADPSVAALLAQ